MRYLNLETYIANRGILRRYKRIAIERDSHCSLTMIAATKITPTNTKITLLFDILYLILFKEMVGIREIIKTLTIMTQKQTYSG